MIIKSAKTHKLQTHISLSRNTDKSIANALTFLQANSKKPLIIAFGSVEPFRTSNFDVALITSMDTFADDIKSIQTAVATKKYDGIMIDSVSLLLRLLRAHVAGDGSPSLQEFGQINNQFINAVLLLRALTDTFVSTASFILDEEASKKESKAKGRSIEVWDLDFTSTLSASVFPMFGNVAYVAGDDQVVTDRDLAIAGKTPLAIKATPQKKVRKTVVKKA